MSHKQRVGLALVAAFVTTIAPGEARSQERPYRLVEGWAQLPSGVDAWGQTIGVELDEAAVAKYSYIPRNIGTALRADDSIAFR